MLAVWYGAGEISWLLLPLCVQAATVTYTVPSTAPTSAAKLAPAPVGLSFEFFAYPSYFINVTATNQCLANFKDLSGTWPPIRIGGTTQDRATYDPSTSAYVVYTVKSPVDAPASLTFGPNLMKLASTYPGTVVLGLNRGHNDISNTIAAAQSAKGSMRNLKAIELGNEPEYYSGVQPIASPSWSPTIDAASQNTWDIQVGTALQSTNIIQAGNSNASPPTWGAAELIASGNVTVRTYVRDYAHHNYPGGTLQRLMSHSGIVSNLAPIGTDGKAANAVGKEYVLGETNSVAGGGAATVSPTFGAAIWTLDYTLQATTLNITTIYYHHGTIGACYYCWWGRYDAGAPYYGAWLAAAAFAGSSYIQQVDSGNTNYGIYVLYNSNKVPSKAVLINSDYFNGTGTRGSETFVLRGLTAGKATKAKRLTAGGALSRVDQGSNPSFGGQIVANGTCVIGGKETFESGTVGSAGTASFTVAASEALLIYF
ncbi:glycoside hydrolase family 79 protein [Sclerotinia borealis F-4128]|uniref:Glycoside hydrolase family 79 protein n=1 Tax=Sclerotinia borealis (strain F-4128) TaxID=1432307 RepID=W9CDL6_SCLBF|nr:glycoside hydrolase family 79 protein [Sclerotinia borealis F-4128]